MKLRRDSRPYKILKYLALGAGFLVISTASPYGGALAVRGLIKEYFHKRGFEKYRFLNDLKNLQKRELIDYQDLGDGKIKITITKKGQQKTLVYSIDELKIKKPNRWDKKWRLVMFDIPHNYKKARDAFRAKLRNLDFYPLQKSVFLTPYPCEDELEFLASVFDIRKYILILYVNHFEGEEKLKHYFKLS
jgi:DNA-binding transcriptional regulator PaaX